MTVFLIRSDRRRKKCAFSYYSFPLTNKTSIMGMKSISALLAVMLLVEQASSQWSPRFCRYNNIASEADVLICENLTAESDLEDDLQLSSKFHVKQLIIANSSMRFFLHQSFQNTKFEVISIKNCSLLSLSDTDVAFEGLENYLQKLFIYNSSMVNHLDWYHLRNLKDLGMVTISGSDLDYVDDTLSSISSSMNLMALRLTSNHISWVHPKAFAKLQRISAIRLGHNVIETLQRSMFHESPTELMTLDFSYNLLQTLPSDLFHNMKTLLMVNLEGNQIITMDEKVFGDVLSQFIILSILNNPLRCDCRMKWLTKLELDASKIRARCFEPSNLRNRSVTELNVRDLWC